MCWCALFAQAVVADCSADRFQQGVDLAEKGRTAEALAVFRGLTEKDSSCLEAWNNRAALEAVSGDMAASQRSLSRALSVRRDVQSVTANLEKLRSRMARLAYDSAFGTPSKLPPLQLELQKDLPKPSRAKASVNSDSLTRALARAQDEIRSLTRLRDSLLVGSRVAQAPVSDTSSRQVVSASPIVAVPAGEVPPVAVAPSAVKVAPPPISAPAHPVEKETPESAALHAVQAWASAWSAQNVDAYLGYYDTQFVPPDKLSRKAWEDRRRERILAPKAIHVEIVSPVVKKLSSTQVEVVYKQVYQTEEVRLALRKRLLLTKRGKEWKIESEREAR